MNKKEDNHEDLDILPYEDLKEEQLVERLHSVEGQFAEKITEFAGSMGFVYVHAIWFAFWITANQGWLKPYIPAFDPFPYGLLTMVVSLEAIFLSTFIMISQNRQALVDVYRELEEDKEEAEEEKEQEELGRDVDEIQDDLDEMKKALMLIQNKLTNVEKAHIHTSPPRPKAV